VKLLLKKKADELELKVTQVREENSGFKTKIDELQLEAAQVLTSGFRAVCLQDHAFNIIVAPTCHFRLHRLETLVFKFDLYVILFIMLKLFDIHVHTYIYIWSSNLSVVRSTGLTGWFFLNSTYLHKLALNFL